MHAAISRATVIHGNRLAFFLHGFEAYGLGKGNSNNILSRMEKGEKSEEDGQNCSTCIYAEIDCWIVLSLILLLEADPLLFENGDLLLKGVRRVLMSRRLSIGHW